ncbi:hypothetical protein DPMN_163555 [Dreissena polymorpha]|uniref:Uncharacterized protein n=1 Tax=Dreissena polymorpha TaxID=45954 RepID=A0A9D4ISX5_DREPO|nr:hypothetical protein DPMN_163555 [Dreissena polymorpha]
MYLFSHCCPFKVWPVNHFPDDDINNASNRLVAQHASAFPSERILMQVLYRCRWNFVTRG